MNRRTIVLFIGLAAITEWEWRGSAATPPGMQPWLADARILVDGVGRNVEDCRSLICPHNENTDLTRRGSSIYLVHRTAQSQVLGPNSSLRVSRSDDGGRSFELLAVLPAPLGRDLRDPHFYDVGGKLAIKALTRLPVVSARDSDVDTVTVATLSDDDGHTWTPFAPIGPPTWSFWRIKQHAGVDYAAAYEDGDRSVKLFRSSDGATWTPGPVIYGAAADTPLETELVFMP